jgi:radical SAM superfamily enzyme YgiQ (UPF0313 family)
MKKIEKSKKRYRRVLLVQFPSDRCIAMRPPPGIGYLASALKMAGIDYDIFDMTFSNYNLNHLKNKIKEFKPDLIGISFFTLMYKRHYEWIRELKEMNLGFDIICGGPHASSVKEKILEECDEIDYCCVNEGEETLIELCQGKSISDIKGLIHRQMGKIIYNGDREFIRDLNGLPFPTFEKFELEKYVQKEIPLVTSRGCPFRCIFCSVRLVMGRLFRARSPENVVDEIEYWVKRGYRQFAIVDDNFTLIPKRVFDICDEIERRNLGYLEFRLNNGVRADKVTKEMLIRMRDVGFRFIKIAVEGGNNKVLKSLHKDETIETIENAIKMACEAGLEVYANWVVGAPEETWEDVKDSFRLAIRSSAFKTDFLNLIPTPNTELFDWVKKNNYFIVEPEVFLNDPSYYYSKPVFETPLLSAKDRLKVDKIHRAINRKLMRKMVERRLKSYGLLIAKIISMIIASDVFQKLFYTNKTFRRCIDLIRSIPQMREDKYRKMRSVLDDTRNINDL